MMSKLFAPLVESWVRPQLHLIECPSDFYFHPLCGHHLLTQLQSTHLSCFWQQVMSF